MKAKAPKAVKAPKIGKAEFINAIKQVQRHDVLHYSYGIEGGPRCAIGHMKTVVDKQTGKFYGFLGAEVARAMGFEFDEIAGFNDGATYSDGRRFRTDRATKEELMTFFAFGAAGAFKDLKP